MQCLEIRFLIFNKHDKVLGLIGMLSVENLPETFENLGEAGAGIRWFYPLSETIILGHKYLFVRSLLSGKKL